MKRKISFFIFFFLFITKAQALVLIANASNSLNEIRKDQLQDFFFKRVRSWPDGKPVRFFDRLDNSSLRNTFLAEYLNKSSRQVEQFWIAQKFNTGDSAPTQITSDSLMINLVSRFPGGVGYVSDNTDLPAKVKVLKITD